MPTQTWPLSELQQLDRETRKVIKESSGSHLSASMELLYLPRTSGGRGLRSVESEYKVTKVKVAAKLFSNQDDTMSMV